MSMKVKRSAIKGSRIPAADTATLGAASRPAVPPLQKKGSGDENKTGMPDDLKAGIENLSGMTMDDVKVHYNSSQPAALNALAFAQGTDIHIGGGQERHLPHEAWHVVQQKQGRVKPTMQMQNTPVNDDPGLEEEADRMGAKALQMKYEHPQPAMEGALQKQKADAPAKPFGAVGQMPHGIVQRAKWIRKKNGQIVEVADDYKKKPQEKWAERPITDEERERDKALKERRAKLIGIPREVTRTDRDFSSPTNSRGQGKAHFSATGLKAAGDTDITPAEQLDQQSVNKGSGSSISFTGPNPRNGGNQYGPSGAQKVVVKARKIARAKLKGKADAQHLNVLTSREIGNYLDGHPEVADRQKFKGYVTRDDEHQIQVGAPATADVEREIPKRFLYGGGFDESHDSDSESETEDPGYL